MAVKKKPASAPRKSTLERQLGKLLIEWQKRLKLQDWHITLHMQDHEFEGYASVRSQLAHGTAVINFRDVKFTPARSKYKAIDDPEVTLVHELLHVRFDFIDGYRKSTTEIEELAIEMTAQALVAAKRGKVDIRA